MAVEVKICGVTLPADAAFAAAHGAWRIGVIFAGGPRTVTVAQAREIVVAAAGVPVIGVFGATSSDAIRQTVVEAGLAGAQLHDPAARESAAALHAAGRDVWRVIPIDAATVDAGELAHGAEEVDATLVEARVPGGSGGKGIVISLDVARAARVQIAGGRFVLAGGLRPETVAEAIRVVGPDVVDVSSGIESSPGIKDRGQLARFMENVFAARTSG